MSSASAKGPVLIQIGRMPERVRPHELPVGERGVEALQPVADPGRIAMRCKAHRRAFAIAVLPAEGFRHIAVKPAERGVPPPFGERLDRVPVTEPDRRRDVVADAVHRHDQAAIVAPAGEIGRRRVAEMMLHEHEVAVR